MHLEGHGTLFSGIEKLVCRIAKSSAPAESILKKESHTLRFDKTYPDF